MQTGYAQEALKPLRACQNAYDNRLNLELTFDLTHSQVPGTLAESTHSVRVQNKHYRIDSTNKAQGMLALFYSGEMVMKSEGFFSARGGFDPVYYSEKRGSKKIRETVVDTATKTIQFKRKNTEAPWQAGVQDRLSLTYQLSSLLQCNRQAEGMKGEFPVMTTKALEKETFEFKKTESLELYLNGKKQSVEAAMFQNTPIKGDDIIRVWYAPKMQFLPLRLDVEDEDGKTISQTLTGYKVIEPAS